MARTIRNDLHVVQSVRQDIVILQLGPNDLLFRAPLLVGSDPEDFVRLLLASYGVQFVMFAKLFGDVVQQRHWHFNALPSSGIRRLRTNPTHHLLGSQSFLEGTVQFLGASDGVHLNSRG